MTTTTTRTVTPRRQPVAARRTGYLFAAGFHAAVLYLAFVEPGWRAVPFLTEETTRVLGLFTVSVVAGLVANLLYVAVDEPALLAFGNVVTTAIGLAVMVRIWQVFPFDFAGYSVDWALVARVVLIVGMAGAAIGLLVQVRALAVAATGSRRGTTE